MSDVENNQNPVSDPVQDDAAAKLKKTEIERDEYLNGWKRAKADLINNQRDEAKRLSEAIAFGGTDLIKDFLVILDSFDFALTALKGDEMGQKGLLMIKSQFEATLKKRGVEKIIVSPGDEPDPRLHEPMSEVDLPESDSKFSGKIVDELSSGYTLSGRVIRPAKVRIGKQTS
jgi:molecular chaperone GrpE